jgi:DNA repair exonuclease SbcCD ATPase subunit
MASNRGAAKTNTMHSEMLSYSVEDRRKNIIIKLINFRTYGDVEIKIPLNSVTLINGPSGVGKTTILEAFIFLMYDGIANPERFKTKRCWGWLFIGDLIIYRQKDAALLKVWRSNISPGNPSTHVQEFTQTEAQAEIDRVYGTQEIFCGCSYLKQKEFSVFLTGTDAEKLAIIKTVAMRGGDTDELKAPIKAAVAGYREQMASSRAQFEMALSNIQVFDRRHPDLVKYQVPENTDEVMAKVRELRDSMVGLDGQLEEASKIKATVDLLRQQMDIHNQRKGQVEAQMKQIDPAALKARLTTVEEKLKEFSGVEVDAAKLAKAQLFRVWTQEGSRILAKLQEAEKDYELCSVKIRQQLVEFPAYVPAGTDPLLTTAERQTYQKDAFDRIEKWRGKFESVRAANQDVALLLDQIQAKTIADAKKLLAAAEEELKKSTENEAKVRADLTARRQANKMKCPTCQVLVIVSEDGRRLEKCQDAPQGIGTMLGTVDPTKTELPPISNEDLAKAVGQTTNVTAKRNRIQTVITAVEEKLKFDLGGVQPDVALTLLPLFSTYQNLKLAVDNIRDSYKNHHANKPEEISEKPVDTSTKSNLENERNHILQSLSASEQYQRQLADLDINIQQFAKMLADASSKQGPSPADITKRRTEIQNQIDQLLHLSSATDLIGQRSILEKTLLEKRTYAETSERECKASERLLERAVEAERISLEAAVAEINGYLSQILKRLFINSPISVALSTTKKLKSKKDAVSQRFDIQLFYNNSEYGSVRQMSGGEKDRLSLAITLAMSQKFGGSMLFLDETLSSLDAELKSEAVQVLKEFAGSRTVVCISHEETEGLYDNVIRIKQNT